MKEILQNVLTILNKKLKITGTNTSKLQNVKGGLGIGQTLWSSLSNRKWT
jgi:hypothetical protein